MALQETIMLFSIKLFLM